MKHSVKRKHRTNIDALIFLDVSLNYDIKIPNQNIESMDEKTFEAAIKLALKSLHGETGLSIIFEVLYYEEYERRAFIKVAQKHLVKIWSAMTLFSEFLYQACLFQVHQVETSIDKLQINSSVVRKLLETKSCELTE